MGILDRAIIFATEAHSGMFRKGTDTPYILHPSHGKGYRGPCAWREGKRVSPKAAFDIAIGLPQSKHESGNPWR
jgi:hypothetical protein